MKKYEGKRWGDISVEDKKMLLKNAVCRDILLGLVLTDGSGCVHFSETLAAMGTIHNGVINIDDDEILYNPCIKKDKETMSQEELGAQSDEHVEKNTGSRNDGFIEYEMLFKERPHVVLLGAGASVATIPEGDKNGKKISAMKGFIKKLGMSSIISSISLNTKSDNLEDIYMEIYERDDCNQQRKLLEERIVSYFSDFELPDEPTIYDMLILSLTKKDLIATFNWDPLLVEAYIRCTEITNNLPQLAFLHGNVAIATCEKDMFLGRPYDYCPRCGKRLSVVPLLYPIREKNYESNPYIASSWEQLSQYLERAYRLTIFGYSAPKSDKAAIDMLKKAWGKVSDRNLEEIEIIDIRPENEVIASWEEFIHTHHYSVFDNFYDSALGKFPRRTCELLFDNTQKNMWMHGDKGFAKKMNFVEIISLLQPLLEDEKSGRNILSDPYVL